MHHIFKCSEQEGNLLYAWFAAMHTRIDMLLTGPLDEQEMVTAAEEIGQEVALMERLANCFDPDSDLAHVNREAHRRWVPLSEELYQLLGQCLEHNEKTAGLFDIAVGSLPYDATTIRQIRLRPHEIRFLRSGISLNLSGFLKGVALEKARAVLHRHGIGNALVSMGNSSVMALGHQRGMDGWRVSLPDGSEGIVLKDQCLTTSGNDTAERSHIVNPLTGQAIRGKRSVSVVTACGTDGEVLSTALFLADEAQCEQLHRRYQFEHVYRIGGRHFAPNRQSK